MAEHNTRTSGQAPAESHCKECGCVMPDYRPASFEFCSSHCKTLWENNEALTAERAQQPQGEVFNAELLKIAVQNHCSCGGSGPFDDECCPACHVWHDLVTKKEKT